MFNSIKRIKLSNSVKRKTAHLGESKWKRYRLLIIIFVVGIIALIAWLLQGGFVNVHTIVITPSFIKCAGEPAIRQASGVEGKNIFLIQGSEVERKVKEKFLCIKSLNLEKSFPQKVSMQIEEREPVAVLNVLPVLKELEEATPSSQTSQLDFTINTASSQGQFLVDNTGLVYDTLQESVINTPMVYISSGDVAVGRVLKSEQVQGVLEIIKKLKELAFEIKNIKVEGNKVLIDGASKVVFSLKKDLNVQLVSLQLILQKAKMDSRPIDIIDLRFDKPVVIFAPKK